MAKDLVDSLGVFEFPREITPRHPAHRKHSPAGVSTSQKAMHLLFLCRHSQGCGGHRFQMLLPRLGHLPEE